MAINGDTNVASRGGEGACAGYSARREHYCKRGHSNPRQSRLSPAVRQGVYRTKSRPGGSADLLIITSFSHRFNYLST
ncbi:triphosphoribosyl-dephospho-CoA synthase [Shigella flexneri]